MQVYVPYEWHNVISMARKKDKITVVPLEHSDFMNIKPFVETSHINLKTSTNGERINWLKIKHIQVNKGSDEVFVRYNFHDDLKTVAMIPRRKGRRGSNLSIANLAQVTDPPCYTGRLPVAVAKKKDLLQLCTSGAIPNVYRNFYEDLPTSETARDALPMPDACESEYDTD